MDIKFADRMDHFKDGIFTVPNAKRMELIKEGRRVFDFSVGTPDFVPEKAAMEAECYVCISYGGESALCQVIRVLKKLGLSEEAAQYEILVRQNV